MIITQIRFENYRAYYGEVIFDFPIDGERNVSIIFANNDVGKTCFFSGVLFCLYGSKDSDSLKDLITDKYRQIIAPYVKTEYYLDNVGDSTWPKTTIAHKEVY